MTTTLTSKGQVTIPKRIRDEMHLLPGAPVEFSINAAGEVVLHPARPAGRARKPTRDRFDAVRGRADVHWRRNLGRRIQRCGDCCNWEIARQKGDGRCRVKNELFAWHHAMP